MLQVGNFVINQLKPLSRTRGNGITTCRLFLSILALTYLSLACCVPLPVLTLISSPSRTEPTLRTRSVSTEHLCPTTRYMNFLWCLSSFVLLLTFVEHLIGLPWHKHKTMFPWRQIWSLTVSLVRRKYHVSHTYIFSTMVHSELYNYLTY